MPRRVGEAATATEPIRITRRLAVSPGDAFATFVDRFQAWWPREATWSGDAVESIGIEPRVGGFAFERGPYGQRLDWGRVTAWEPPSRIAFTWQIGPDRVPVANPARASEVEVTFEADGGETRFVLEHRGFDRHGERADAYRTAMAGDGGWPSIVDRYVAAVQRRVEAPWEGLTT